MVGENLKGPGGPDGKRILGFSRFRSWWTGDSVRHPDRDDCRNALYEAARRGVNSPDVHRGADPLCSSAFLNGANGQGNCLKAPLEGLGHFG